MAGHNRFCISMIVILVMVVSPVRPALAMGEGADMPGEESFVAQAAADSSAARHRFWRIYPAVEKGAPQWAAEGTGQEQPEPAFTPSLAVQEDDRLVLTSAQEFVVPGESINLSLQVSDIPKNAQVVISLPPGVHPGEGNAWAFDDTAREQRLPAQAVQHIPWFVSSEATGPFVFTARLVDGEEVVAESHLALDQAVRGQADARGGQVRWPERGIAVTLPEGAVDEDVDLIIRQTVVNPIAVFSPSGSSFVIDAWDHQGNSVETFSKPVIIQVQYDPVKYAGNESSLFLSYYDDATGVWMMMPTSRDMENNLIWTETNHFSEWDVEVNNWEAARLPTLDAFQTSTLTGAATFNLPLDLPPGPGGFQPSLNLTYNSASVDSASLMTQGGWVGLGWNLDIGHILRNQHGTSDELMDDSFSFVANGAGGMMVAEAHEETDSVIRYYLLNEDFWKIEYLKDEMIWLAWDKTGNHYIFGGYYTNYPDINSIEYDFNARPSYPAGCDGSQPIKVPWKWGLRQIINPQGKIINISWYRDGRQYKYCNDQSADGAVGIESYPIQIDYPAGGYRIVFELSDQRQDFSSAWHLNNNTFYTREGLSRVVVQKFDDGAWSEVWYYDLIYAHNIAETDPTYNNFIFPAFKWFYWSEPDHLLKNMTLVGVQKCFSDGGCDPALSFEYGDGMHLTAAENGQGGRIEYSYEPWHEIINTHNTRDGVGGPWGIQDNLCHDDGRYGTYGWNEGTNPVGCSVRDDRWYMALVNEASNSLPVTLTRPGSVYRLDVSAAVNGPGPDEDWIQAGIRFGASDFFDLSEPVAVTGSVYYPSKHVFFLQNSILKVNYATSLILRGPAFETCDGKVCSGVAVFKATFQPVPTHYRVVAKTVIDGVSGDALTTTYTYDEPATNDVVHSDLVAESPSQCGQTTPYNTRDDVMDCYAPVFGQFRGHAATMVTSPAGVTTATYFHQDDIFKGNPSASLSYVRQYADNFETGWDTSQWTANLSGGENDAAEVVRYEGDQALVLTEGEGTEWSAVRGTSTVSADGRSVIVQFKASPSAAYALGLHNEDGNYYRLGIYGDNTRMKVEFADGVGSDFHTAGTLMTPNEGYEPGAWYVAVFTMDHDGGYTVRVWKRDDPAVSGVVTLSAQESGFDPGLGWHFFDAVRSGTIWLDEYVEADLYALRFTGYALETNPNGITVDPPICHEYPNPLFAGFDVHWVYQVWTETYRFEGGSVFQATRTEFTYDPALQGGAQYGNRTGTTEMEWAGSGWEAVRQSRVEYAVNIADGRNLTGLPAVQTVHACPDGACSVNDVNLLASSQTWYDGNTTPMAPPTAGIPTQQRALVGEDAGGNLWADTVLGYDAWGNQTTMTIFTGYGRDDQPASEGARTTTTTYDPVYHTYAESVQSPLPGHLMTMTYDTRLGLPVSMTDPNGLTTTLSYDTRGRLAGLTRNGVQEMTFVYHEAQDTGTGWTPFWTEATQILSPDQSLSVRKFYDGLGRPLQTQVVGVDLFGEPDGASAVITDTFYNAQGQPWLASVPYAAAIPAGFHADRGCGQVSCTLTTYDPLGRVVETTPPDGASASMAYRIEDGLAVTAVIDPLGRTTESFADVWGQTVAVQPQTGPWIRYTYDPKGQLTQVDQIASGETAPFGTTTLTYDLGGRKVAMDDPDMGTWHYAHDALGNLMQQTDARGCSTDLTYDALNRPTGKTFGGPGACAETPAVTYTYDEGPNGIGRRTGMTDASGQTAWAYDLRGNLVLEEKTVNYDGESLGTYTTARVYDLAGRMTGMTYPNGETVDYEYHPQGALDSLGSDLDTYLASAGYDEAGRVVTQVFGNATEVLYTYYGWDEQGGRLAAMTAGGPAGTLQDLGYAYDAAGNLTGITDGVNAETHAYTYDALDRLTGWEVTGGGFEAYTYDPATGSLASKAGKTLQYDDPNHLHAVSGTGDGDQYVYDANGNMTERHLADGQVQHLTYDAEGRLVGAEISFEGRTLITEYVYDGDGNQVIAVVEDYLRLYIGGHFELQVGEERSLFSGPCPAGTYCTYLPLMAAATRSGPAGVRSFSLPWPGEVRWRSYYFAGGRRIAMRSSGEGQGETGEAVWFLSDHLGSTSLTVDEGGGVLAAWRYDPWGSPRDQDDLNDLLTDYTYTGQRSEAALGLMYYVARWYDSGIGHFIQADTIVPGAGNPAAWNRYGYVMYNPMKYTDPTGHIPVIDDPELRVLLSGYYQDREPPAPDDIPEINPDNPYPNNDEPNAPHPHDPNYDDDGWEWGNWPGLGWGWRHREDPTGTVWRPDKGYRGRKGDGEIPHWHGRRPNLPDILYPPEDVYRRGRGRGQLPLPPEDIFNPDEDIYPKPGEIPLFDPIVVIPLVPLTIIPIIILSKGGGGGITINLNECFQ